MQWLDKNLCQLIFDRCEPFDAVRLAKTCRRFAESHRLWMAKQIVPPHFASCFSGKIGRELVVSSHFVLQRGVLLLGLFRQATLVEARFRALESVFEEASVPTRRAGLIGDDWNAIVETLPSILRGERCVLLSCMGFVEEDMADWLAETLFEYGRKFGCCVVVLPYCSSEGPRGKIWEKCAVVKHRSFLNSEIAGSCALQPEQRVSMFAVLVGGQSALTKVPTIVRGSCSAPSKLALVIATFRHVSEVPFIAFRDVGRGVFVFVNCDYSSQDPNSVLSRVLMGACAFGLLRSSSK